MHVGRVLSQNSFPWGLSGKDVLPSCLNTSGLYSAHQSVPYVSRPWLIKLSPNTHNHADTLPYTGAELWMTHWHWDDPFVTSLHLYKVRLSAVVPLYTIWSFHFVTWHLQGVHDGLERWCLTAATLNRDSVGADTEPAVPKGHRAYNWADELVWGQNTKSFLRKI